MEKKQLKIAFLNVFQGSSDRGAETFVTELSRGLKITHEILVLEGKEVPRKRWPILWRFYMDPFGLQTLIFTVKQLSKLYSFNPDVIIPVNGGWQPAIIRAFTWITRKKMIISGQSGIGWDDRMNLLCFPNIFVATTSHQAKWAKRFAPWTSILVIPNGVDLKKFSPAGAKLPLSLKSPVILAVGALIPEKRLELAIKAVGLLPEASLLIVGSGYLKEELDKQAKESLRGRYSIISTTHDKMPDIYRSVDVFTLTPSAREAFGIVFLEAMATSLPVVTSNDPIRKEIVGGAGILVDPENTEEYAQALANTLSYKWENKPRKQAENYSWDDIANQYLKVFKELYT